MEELFTGFYDRRVDGSRKWECVPESLECHENEIIPMTVADLDLPTPPKIKKAIIDYVDKKVLGYSNPTPYYLNVIKNHIQEFYDYTIEPEWIITTPGIVPALATSVRAFSKPGDGVIMFPPVYYPFYEVVESQGRKIEGCPMFIENGQYQIDFDLFEELAKKETSKLLILCSPHNPGGRVWTKEELEKISEISVENNLIVVSDEIHADLTFDHTEHHILSAINDEIAQRSIICTAASKAFNIAGLQSSNIFIPNDQLREEFIVENQTTGLQVANVLGMKATEVAYAEETEWLEQLMEVLKTNRQLTIDYFTNADERFEVMAPDASFLAWVNIEKFNLSNEEFMAALEKDCQLYVTDGNIYGEHGDGWLRINFGMSTELLETNLKRLEKLSV